MVGFSNVSSTFSGCGVLGQMACFGGVKWLIFSYGKIFRAKFFEPNAVIIYPYFYGI